LGEKIGHFTFRNIVEIGKTPETLTPDLRNSKIKDIDCFKAPGKTTSEDFPNIRRLNFDNNLLTNIDSLIGIRSLRFLSLNNNKIERLCSADSNMKFDDSESATKGKLYLFPRLEELYLGFNQITKISELGLFRFPMLRNLHLQGNKISKIDGLEHMTNLITLVLDKNIIRAADPISFLSLITLRELHLKENRIRSLSNFDSLPNLARLFLQSNRIQDMSELEVPLPLSLYCRNSSCLV
jgi:Leucine-rich repeat (LRR) protein